MTIPATTTTALQWSLNYSLHPGALGLYNRCTKKFNCSASEVLIEVHYKFYLGAFTNRDGPECTGTDRNGQEWTSITGTDLKIHPKIHVLSVLDKKFWLSNIKYKKPSVSKQFQCKKSFLKYFLS